ncbi:MAG: hypothetical protein ACRDY7_09505, partial [Acidimicrobiia bacterium]
RSGSQTRVETIDSRGGTVAVRYEDGRVRLNWARPDPGYEVKVADDGPTEVVVRFMDGRRRSVVRAFYRDGMPAHEVRENDDRDGDDGDGQDDRDDDGDEARDDDSDDRRDGDGDDDRDDDAGDDDAGYRSQMQGSDWAEWYRRWLEERDD